VPEYLTAHATGTVDNATWVPPVFLPQDVVAIEKPQVRRCRIDTRVRLGDDGRAVLRRTAAGFTGEGRVIVVLVRVDS
jgi:hypothetical protein